MNAAKRHLSDTNARFLALLEMITFSGLAIGLKPRGDSAGENHEKMVDNSDKGKYNPKMSM